MSGDWRTLIGVKMYFTSVEHVKVPPSCSCVQSVELWLGLGSDLLTFLLLIEYKGRIVSPLTDDPAMA